MITSRKLKRAASQRAGRNAVWVPAQFNIYGALNLRMLDASATDEITPAAHAAWVDRIDAGGLDCLRCGRALAFGGARQPFLLGAATFNFERRLLFITAFCLACCLDLNGPERAADELAALAHGARGQDRASFTHHLDHA
jgi:hypothetical protein